MEKTLNDSADNELGAEVTGNDAENKADNDEDRIESDDEDSVTRDNED